MKLSSKFLFFKDLLKDLGFTYSIVEEYSHPNGFGTTKNQITMVINFWKNGFSQVSGYSFSEQFIFSDPISVASCYDYLFDVSIKQLEKLKNDK